MRNTLPLSSFPLQALLTFETYYQPALSLVFLLILLYKTFNLPYTAPMMAQQGILQGIFFVGMTWRIRLGKIANRTQDSTYMLLFIVSTLLACFMAIYFIVIQYYVLLIEIILIVVLLVADGFELLLGFLACWMFQSYEKQQ